MRTILLLSIALISVGWVATQIDSAPRGLPPGGIHRQWRRTAQGWQPAELWKRPPPRGRDFLPHPCILALGELLAALFAWTAFAPCGSSDRSAPQFSKLAKTH